MTAVFQNTSVYYILHPFIVFVSEQFNIFLQRVTVTYSLYYTFMHVVDMHNRCANFLSDSIDDFFPQRLLVYFFRFRVLFPTKKR